MSKRKTVIVLEHCWDDWATPINKEVSVAPYIDGVCRLNNLELFYARYVGGKSFDEIVERFQRILQDKDRRIILYIAGHGSDRTIGGKRLLTLMRHLWESSNALNIEGCILGGCYFGNNIDEFKSWMSDSKLVWLVGYRHAVDWLPSTLYDVSLVGNLLSTPDSVFESRTSLENLLRQALSIFNPSALISTDKDGNRQSLSDTISCVIQPRRQGQRPVEIDLISTKPL